MEKQIQELRRVVQRRRRRSRGRAGYGSELRADVVALSSTWRESGGTNVELARRLGLSRETLGRWCDAKPPVRMVEVIEEPIAVTTTVVLLPGEVRVEGLTIEQIAELSRRLR